MTIAIIVAVAAIAVIAVIAIITGMVKGFTRTKTWAAEYVLTAAITILVFTLADTSGMNAWAALALKVGVPAALTVVFAVLFNRFKALVTKGIEKAQKRSYYMQYGDIEQNKLEILDSIELGDRRSYGRLARRRFKYGRGGAGIADRVLGAVILFLKAAVVFCAIATAALVVIDLSGYGESFSLYSGKLWSFISRIAADLFVAAVIFFAMRAGFRTGLAGALWALAILGFICGAAYLAFSNLAAYEDIAVQLSSWLSEKLSALGDLDMLTVAECIIAFAIFVVAFIFIIIVGLAVGGVISRAREGKAFGFVDGLFGAVVALVIALAILLVLGGLLWSISGSEAMQAFNAYIVRADSDGNTYYAAIASAFYIYNPLNSLGLFENLPFYLTLTD